MTDTTSNAKSDVYARFQTGSTAGRGSITGWTSCPLCCIQASTSYDNVVSDTHKILRHIPSNNDVINALSNPKQSKSVKLFSHGRGLASHLHAVHTPWNPGKAELKRRVAHQKRMENEQRRSSRGSGCCERPNKKAKLNVVIDDSIQVKWDPSNEEVEQWNQRIKELVNLVEFHSRISKDQDGESNPSGSIDEKVPVECSRLPSDKSVGTDRNGNAFPSYRDSLPTFLSAAANGDITTLRNHINDCDVNSNGNTNDFRIQHINRLISCRDRNGSTAEHWAAGGGHVECLTYLLELRDLVSRKLSGKQFDCKHSDQQDKSLMNHSYNKKIRRRRDGKTSLHYAARNGHISCIDLIISRSDTPFIDVPSGDGTTPLHMACYGGHASTVRHLVEKYHANVHAVNEWACGTGHWSAMSLGDDGTDSVINICSYLKDAGVDFVKAQNQGHSPLHKAASKNNRAVIEWLAGNTKEGVPRFSEDEIKLMGRPDKGGNAPSDIWLSVGGCIKFSQWIKKQFE